MNRSAKIKKYAALLMLIMRFSSLGCFAYSGYVGIKAYGPDGWKMTLARIKSRMTQDENDPLVLAMKEREARKAAEAQGVKNGRVKAAGSSSDNPYDYIQGGKAGSKPKKSDKDEESSQDDDAVGLESRAGAGVGEGKASLWDKNKMGEGGFGGISGFGAGGVGGSGGGGNSSGSGAADKLKSAAASMGAAASNAGASSGKSARSAKAGTSRGAFGRRATGSSKNRLKGAVATAGRGGTGGFQTGAGYTGASFGEGSTGKTLDIADATGDLAAGSDLAASVDNPTDESQYETDVEDLDIEETTSEYDDESKTFAILSLVVTGMAVGLMATLKMRQTAESSPEPYSKAIVAAWWVAYAIGAALIIGLAAWAVSFLQKEDDAQAQALGLTMITTLIAMTAGWATLAFSEGGVEAIIGQVSQAAGQILGLVGTSSSGSSDSSDDSSSGTT
ncbi:MAG: hypothetical protein HY547_07275 [Elusimicrobia bacterium]|nr:hypothetical protein [Elusimicrobiota bacterium]